MFLPQTLTNLQISIIKGCLNFEGKMVLILAAQKSVRANGND